MATIQYTRCRMVPTPSSLAASLGLLEAPWETGTSDVNVSVEFGDFDHKDDRLWMRHAGSVKSIWARSQVADTRVVALSRYESAEPVYVRADSAIRQPADLRGKRIALPCVPGRVFDVDRHVYLMPLVHCLTSAGLRVDDVILVDTPFERPKVQNPVGAHEPRNFFEVVAELFTGQLLRGDVDAIVTVLPQHLSNDARLRKLYDPRDDARLSARGELRMLNVSGPMLREHRRVVVDAVARLLQARDWAAKHSDQVPPLVARELSVSDTALQAREIDFDRWPEIGCGPELVSMLEARKDLMLAIGSIKHDFSVADWVDPSVVVEARRKVGQ